MKQEPRPAFRMDGGMQKISARLEPSTDPQRLQLNRESDRASRKKATDRAWRSQINGWDEV